jgi:hypothetical protein
MVESFLAAVLNSPPFKPTLGGVLAVLACQKHSSPTQTCRTPRRTSGAVASRRVQGYRQNRELFAGFPDEVIWHDALLSRP